MNDEERELLSPLVGVVKVAPTGRKAIDRRELTWIRSARKTVAKVPVHGVKATREALCAAQWALGEAAARGVDVDTTPARVARLQMLINEIDVHRPLGPDGKHGNRHTPTCGCE